MNRMKVFADAVSLEPVRAFDQFCARSGAVWVWRRADEVLVVFRAHAAGNAQRVVLFFLHTSGANASFSYACRGGGHLKSPFCCKIGCNCSNRLKVLQNILRWGNGLPVGPLPAGPMGFFLNSGLSSQSQHGIRIDMGATKKIPCWLIFWVLGAFAVTGCVEPGRGPSVEDVRSQIAEAYGIQSLGTIQKLQYTFNQKEGEGTTRRFWIWEPAADRVIFKGDGHQPEVVFDRKDIAGTTSESLRQIDRWFLHDNYWLVLPFRVAWDHHAEVADMGLCKSPLDGQDARCVNVVYPATVKGHIIGDTYKLFLDGDFRILESIYQPADPTRPEQVMRWEKTRPAGPINLSLTRSDAAGRAVIKFSQVGVQMGDRWLWAD